MLERELQQMMSRFGAYTVLGKLGSGANAEVFRVRREGPGGFTKEVAIKVAFPDALESDDMIARFHAEASLAATLRHDNIVQVTNFYQLDGYLAIELELVDGLTLRDVLAIANKAKVRLPPSFSLHVVVEILDALEYLRTASQSGTPGVGIVHRDIKPANIFVNKNGVAKVGDFGIARLPDSDRTEKGTFMGTFRYLPLSAFEGRSASHAWDVWGCSVVLWELLTQRGNLLFEKRPPSGEIMIQLMEALRNLRVPDPASLMSDVSDPVGEVVVKSLHRDPKGRFLTAGDMRRALLSAAPDTAFNRDLVRDVIGSLNSLRGGRVDELRKLRGLLTVQRNLKASGRKSKNVSALAPPAGVNQTSPDDAWNRESAGPDEGTVEAPPAHLMMGESQMSWADAVLEASPSARGPEQQAAEMRPKPRYAQKTSESSRGDRKPIPRGKTSHGSLSRSQHRSLVQPVSSSRVAAKTSRGKASRSSLSTPATATAPATAQLPTGHRRPTWLVTLVMVILTVLFWAFGPDKRTPSKTPASLSQDAAQQER